MADKVLFLQKNNLINKKIALITYLSLQSLKILIPPGILNIIFRLNLGQIIKKVQNPTPVPQIEIQLGFTLHLKLFRRRGKWKKIEFGG